MSTTSPAYPASTLAKLFHLTERRVQQLAKEGILVKSTQGKYDLVGSVQGYVKYLQDRAMGRQDGSYADPSDIKPIRKRLIQAQAERVEQDNQKQRGELIALSKVTDILSELTVLYAASLESLPGRLAHELAGMNDPAQTKQRLFSACRDIRHNTASALQRCAEKFSIAGVSLRLAWAGSPTELASDSAVLVLVKVGCALELNGQQIKPGVGGYLKISPKNIVSNWWQNNDQ